MSRSSLSCGGARESGGREGREAQCSAMLAIGVPIVHDLRHKAFGSVNLPSSGSYSNGRKTASNPLKERTI